MKSVRKLIAIFRRHSPVALAREEVWRAWRPHRAARMTAAMQRGEPRLQFRPVPYYRPDLSSVGDGAAAIVAFADEICLGRFPFLGYKTVELGLSPQWNLDFVSGYQWEHVPMAQMCPVVRHNGSDVKVPWELSRLQFLPVLAKAHLLTGERRYRDAAKTLFSDWNAKNPIGIGVNWTLAMESALRGMSLCFMLSLLQPLQPDEQAWGSQVMRSIWQHLIFTESHIEFSHLVRGNHYLSNIVGLHCMATFLDAPGMERHRAEYSRLIQLEMLHQVFKDGGDYEASFSYHVLMMQMFTSSWLLMAADGGNPPPQFTDRLEAMYRYVAELAGHDGRLPHLGDSDDGRVELLASDLRQMVELPPEKRDSLLVPGCLALGDALFHLGCGGDPSDSAWYGLHPQIAKSDRSRTVAFPQSGVAAGRMDDAEVVLCAIPNGIRGAGSHTHNDKLSIVARLRGAELLCDSGTCWYTRDWQVRNRFRSTAAHNTAAVDHAEQNVIYPDPGMAFFLADQAAVSPIHLSDSGNEIRLSASHTGYRRIGVTHHRTVRLLLNRISIEDILSGAGEHSFEIFWHLPPIWRVEKVARGRGFEIFGPSRVSFTVESPFALDLSHESVPISRTYGGAVEHATRLRIAGSGSFPCAIVTNITW